MNSHGYENAFMPHAMWMIAVIPRSLSDCEPIIIGRWNASHSDAALRPSVKPERGILIIRMDSASMSIWCAMSPRVKLLSSPVIGMSMACARRTRSRSFCALTGSSK